MKAPTLLIVPSLPVAADSAGRIRLTGKFISGMNAYVEKWDGPVSFMAEPDESHHSGNLDDVWVDKDDLRFGAVVTPFESEVAKKTLASVNVVMGPPHPKMMFAPAYCKRERVRYVLATEYSLQTRNQIIDADRLPSWRAWKRKLWEWRHEQAVLNAVKQSAGLQCNGTPTYDAYRSLNNNTLLYFDSRVSGEMLASKPRLDASNAAWSPARPIKLVFSGRLNAMKGADHLIKLARVLRERQVPFTLDIFGDGPLSDQLAKDIFRLDLGKHVYLRGVLDFSTELMPFIQQQADIFVCCHRQGDPSCTYLETMACGVPIIGYDNEAWKGLVELSNAGAAVPIGDWQKMADAICMATENPSDLVLWAQSALKFARLHTFELEFQRRIDQLKKLSLSDPLS